MPRTDVHSPVALRPEDYEFVACGNYGTASVDAYSPLAHEARYLIDEGWRFDSQSGGGCDHCGAHLIYYAILKHIPSHRLIKVGETCLDNRFSLANAEFQRLRKAGKLNRERVRLNDKRTAFLAKDDHAALYNWAATQPAWDRRDDTESFEAKFARYIEQYGEASDKFVAAIRRSQVRQAEWAAKREAENADAKPVPIGRQKVVGKVVSAKYKEGFYGTTLKIVVKDENGFKVYGNCPTALEDEVWKSKDNGDTVKLTFVAALKQAEDDECFGYFQRPSSARIIND